MWLCVSICVRTCMRACACPLVYVCICILVCVRIHACACTDKRKLPFAKELLSPRLAKAPVSRGSSGDRE